MPVYRFLIIPGFAKAGTTFLENQLRREQEMFNFPPTKEIGLFRLRADLQTYLDRFPGFDPGRTFVDASPMYVEPRYNCFEHMKNALYGHKVHLSFCFRSPIQRAFSHYAHDIRGAIREFGFDRYVFEDPRVMSRYLLKQKPIVETALRYFGADNVSGMTLDSPEFDLSPRAKAFVSAHFVSKPSKEGEKFAGGWLPRIYYSASEPLLVPSEGVLYEVPAKCLLVSSGRHSLLEFDTPVEMGERLSACSQSWTRRFDTSVLRDRKAEIHDDYYTACRLAGVEPAESDADEIITMEEPPALPENVTRMLRKIGNVGHFVSSLTSFSGDQPFVFERPSLARDQAELELHFQELTTAPLSEHEPRRKEILATLRRIVDNYGLLPQAVNALLIELLIHRQFDEFIARIEQRPDMARLCDRPRIRDQINFFAAKEPQDKRDRMQRHFADAA